MKWNTGKDKRGAPDLHYIESGQLRISKSYLNAERTDIKYTAWDGDKMIGVFDTLAEAKAAAVK